MYVYTDRIKRGEKRREEKLDNIKTINSTNITFLLLHYIVSVMMEMSTVWDFILLALANRTDQMY